MRRLLVLLTLVATVSATTPTAHAHGDEGVLEVVEASPDDTGSAVTYRLALTYANDGDPVDGATVTATASLRGGSPAASIAMTGTGGGAYEATVAFPEPGRWTVRFATSEPTAEARATFRVVPPPPTTAAPATTTAPTSTIAPDDVELAEDATADVDGPPMFLVVGIVVAGVLMVGAGTALVLRRRREASSSPSSA